MAVNQPEGGKLPHPARYSGYGVPAAKRTKKRPRPAKRVHPWGKAYQGPGKTC